jgi:DNA-binding transcriptional LysR family regulator
MADFDTAQLRRLDLTLLLVFEEAMASGRLATVARRLGLTQSAISHALKRLREIFDDELFIRTPRGVQPTQRALALRVPLADALRLIRGAVRPPRFDPTRDERVFRIAATDYETALFAPLLSDRFARPRFVFRALVRRDAIAALLEGDVDILLGYTWDRGRACEVAPLFDEDYLVVARAGHASLRRKLDLARYAALGHVLVSPGGSLSGIVDRALAAEGLARRVVLAVPYFFAALATVAQTDLVATLPRRIALRHAANFGLQTKPPPLTVRHFPVQMVWSRRQGDDPAIAWLRGEISRAARKVAT